jgi:hypothetical protein
MNLPFAVSIAVLGVVQAALVALPAARPAAWLVARPGARRRPEWIEHLRSPWWALIPALSIVVVVGVVNFYSGSATALTYLALVAVPPLAAAALGWLVHGARPSWALAAIPLFVVAWAAEGSLAGEAAALALSGLACIALGWLLVSVVPAYWLRIGVYAMAAIDTWFVTADLLQGPNAVLTTAAPGAGLPRLQAVHFGAAQMGFGDLFVAALVGCLLANPADGTQSRDIDRFGSRRQGVGAGLVVVLALGFDLLFFAVDTLPATVPVALALALATHRSSTKTRTR